MVKEFAGSGAVPAAAAAPVWGKEWWALYTMLCLVRRLSKWYYTWVWGMCEVEGGREVVLSSGPRELNFSIMRGVLLYYAA